jgi:hypothetical protein
MPSLESSHAAGSRVRVWVTGAALAATIAGTLTLGVAQPASATALDVGTASPQAFDLQSPATEQSRTELPPASPSTSESIAKLHLESGLTWDQLGRLFGVSRRAVHLWAAGKHMNARNIELLNALQGLVAGAPGQSPESRRAWLFAVGQGGRSPIDQYMDEYRRSGPRPASGTGYTPAGLLGMTTKER